MPTPPPGAIKTMDTWLRRYATQATVALSIVVGVTGVMMFFRIAKGDVATMHEWLGMGFVAVAVAHVVRHRQIFTTMLGQPRTRILLGGTAAAAAAFIVLAPPKGPNPFRQAAQVVTKAPLADLAPVVGVSADELANRLRAAGVAEVDTAKSIDAIARATGTDPMKLIGAALKR